MDMLTSDIQSEYDFAQKVLPESLSLTVTLESFGIYATNEYEIWIYLACVALFQFLGVVCEHYSGFLATRSGMKIRSLLTTIIYEKCLNISVIARKKHHSGEILNLVSSDLMNLELFMQRFHFAWSSLLTIITSFVCLGVLCLGWSVLTSLAVGVVIVCIVMFVSILQFFSRTQYLIRGDKRIAVMNEIFEGIKIIKLFAWEKPYFKRIMDFRNHQSKMLWIVFGCVATVDCFVVTTPALTQFGGLFTYYFVNGNLSVTVVLTGIAYFQMLRAPLVFAPEILTRLFTTIISCIRIQTFLEEDDVEKKREEMNEKEKDLAVSVENGDFEWEGKPPKFKKNQKEMEMKEMKKKGKLSEINLKIKKGEFVMIVGAVGSGKSSLVKALINEMPRKSGSVKLSGTTAYCAQEAWNQNETLLNNILFGKPFKADKWDRVIDCCCLVHDIENFKGGVSIEIGEKGANLSGGQKYRIALARACYNDSDIYLLDDPLAAFDAHVGKRIFEECFQDYLKEKTRILISHQLQYCDKVDRIFLLDDGKIIEEGSFQELMDLNGQFKELFINNISKMVGKKRKEKKAKKKKITKSDLKKSKSVNILSGMKDNDNKIIRSEERATGAISLKSIWNFIQILGGPHIILFLAFVFIVSVILYVFNDFWISSLASGDYFYQEYGNSVNVTYCNDTSTGEVANINSEFCNDTNSTDLGIQSKIIEIFWNNSYSNGILEKPGLNTFQGIMIFLGCSLLLPILMFFRGGVFFTVMINAGNKIFKRALQGTFSAPMKFFEENPLGRIMNRFTTDVTTLDTEFGFFTFIAIGSTSSVIFQIILIIATSYGIFTPFIIIIGILYYTFYTFYRKTSRELKRVEAISASPMISSFSETMSGVTTIRAYQKTKEFIDFNRKKIDFYNRSRFLFNGTSRWMMLYMNGVGTVLIVLVGTVSIILSYYFADTLGIPSFLLSLGITKAMTITKLFFITAFQILMSEVRTVVIERLDYYGRNLELEEPDKEQKKKDWKPKTGEIEFRDYNMKYRENLPRVLKDLSFKICDKERIGIVGRTGAGKSSILVALTRIVEGLSGKILIDGQDIRKITTEALRSNVSIIPQDPVLFSGTVRSNLDPFDEYTDEEIHSALKQGRLEKIVEKSNGIHGKVDEGGKNFSLGERQLLCLGRALLKKSKILLLDECTASVDLESDRIIQDTIRGFSATILTIAHRLSTIIDYNKIIVMDQGMIVEYDTPLNLINKPNGTFRKLVEDTPNSEHLIKKIRGEMETETEKFKFECNLGEAFLTKEKLIFYKGEEKKKIVVDLFEVETIRKIDMTNGDVKLRLKLSTGEVQTTFDFILEEKEVINKILEAVTSLEESSSDDSSEDSEEEIQLFSRGKKI